MGAYITLPSAAGVPSGLGVTGIANARVALPSAAGQIIALQAALVIPSGMVSLLSAAGVPGGMAQPVCTARVALASASGRVGGRIRSLGDPWTLAGFPLPRLSGYTYSRDAGLQRTKMHSGATRQRRKWNNGRRNATVSFELETSLLYRFEEYLASYGYDWFNLPMVTGDNASSLQELHVVRVTGDPTYGDLYGENITVTLPVELSDGLA